MIKDIERFNLTDEQVSLLEKYRDEVIEKNKLFNLTSITDIEEFNKKHIIDSLLILEQIE
jgi:16S rRNA (guanine527-N7)-methyltransferase